MIRYFGHFLHANTYRLEQSIFIRFAWLNKVYELQYGKKRTPCLYPLWQALQPYGFYSQWSWFHHHYKGFVALIQLGRCFACLAPDHTMLSHGVMKVMKEAKPIADFTVMRIAPLSVLKGVRSMLRREQCAHIFIAEEGYIRGGMKQRVLRLLWQPL